MLMPAAGATAATTVLPSAAAGDVSSETVEDEPVAKKRSPWTWPLIVLIALLAIVLIGTLIALALNSQGGKADPTTTSAPSDLVERTAHHAERRPPTSEAPTTIQVDRDSYIGLNVDEARGAARGPRPARDRARPVRPRPSPDQANTVSDVNPSGTVQPGTDDHAHRT